MRQHHTTITPAIIDANIRKAHELRSAALTDMFGSWFKSPADGRQHRADTGRLPQAHRVI